MEERDRYRITVRMDEELYSEFQLRRNLLGLTVDKFAINIIKKYIERYPRDDFEFPKGW